MPRDPRRFAGEHEITIRHGAIGTPAWILQMCGAVLAYGLCGTIRFVVAIA